MHLFEIAGAQQWLQKFLWHCSSSANNVLGTTQCTPELRCRHTSRKDRKCSEIPHVLSDANENSTVSVRPLLDRVWLSRLELRIKKPCVPTKHNELHFNYLLCTVNVKNKQTLASKEELASFLKAYIA